MRYFKKIDVDWATANWIIYIPDDIPRQTTGSLGSNNCAVHSLMQIFTICFQVGLKFTDIQCTRARRNLADFLYGYTGYPEGHREKFRAEIIEFSLDECFAQTVKNYDLPVIIDSLQDFEYMTKWESTLEYSISLLK